MEKEIFSNESKCIASLLKRYRNKASLTQTQLATLIGTGQSYVSKIERGELTVSIIDMLHICTALQVDPSKFISDLEIEIKSVRMLKKPTS